MSDMAFGWLQKAIIAAQTLGPGEELTDAAFTICEMALTLANLKDVIEETEKAWLHIRKAAGYLLLDLQNREREARTAFHVAWVLANRLASESSILLFPGFNIVLHGENAEAVSRWIFRGHLPSRRPLMARLSKPSAVDGVLWEKWQNVLKQQKQWPIADALEEIRSNSS